MGLSDEQLKFLEDFILCRPLGHLNADNNSPEQGRISQRDVILAKLTKVAPLPEGQPEEQKTATEYVEQARRLLAGETPAPFELDQAEDALRKLVEHVADVQRDIERVRKPRFEKGQIALAALRNISLEFSAHCPEDDKRAVVKEHRELTDMLAPKKNWANITDWDEEDLIDVNTRLDRLAFDIKNLRQDVEQAVQALEIARAAATRAMTPSDAIGYSEAQTIQMSEMFKVASQEAGQNVLRADDAIKALEKLVKHSTATTRIRERVSMQLADIPDIAPAGASVDQINEWTRLRQDALAALDEVLDP